MTSQAKVSYSMPYRLVRHLLTCEAGWQETGSKSRMLQIYSKFNPSVLAILEKADESKLKVWKLLDMEKMPSFTAGRLAVLGDAAHPFLPRKLWEKKARINLSKTNIR